MIVNPTHSGWEVIYQPAHALLAAQIAAHWRQDERPSRWIETLVALAQHDDEASDWTGRDHLTESGAPLDFMLTEKPSLVQPLEITEALQFKGQWAALLISMHMVFLYEHLRDEGAQFAAFLDEQVEHQKRWRKGLDVSQREADEAYALFQWCDRMSLILCHRELPDDERALEVSAGPDGTRYEVICRHDGVTVKPWPFQDKKFTVSVEALYLTELSFQDDPALQAALKNAPIDYLTWKFEQ